MRRIPHLGFWIFLVIYSIIKYRAVPDLMGTPAYIQSTAILIILTAIIPYFLAWLIVRKISAGNLKYGLAVLLPLVLCLAGLAAYFYGFIAPNAPSMSVAQVLPRAIVPGLVMGALLFLYTTTHANDG